MICGVTNPKLCPPFFTSRIYYCNSLLYGQIYKIQRVQDTAARIIYRLPKFCHISPTLYSLHWLSVKYRMDFKIFLFTFKAIHDITPSYLTNLIAVKTNGYDLRSSNECQLNMPKKITKGDRAFEVAAPRAFSFWVMFIYF